MCVCSPQGCCLHLLCVSTMTTSTLDNVTWTPELHQHIVGFLVTGSGGRGSPATMLCWMMSCNRLWNSMLHPRMKLEYTLDNIILSMGPSVNAHLENQSPITYPLRHTWFWKSLADSLLYGPSANKYMLFPSGAIHWASNHHWNLSPEYHDDYCFDGTGSDYLLDGVGIIFEPKDASVWRWKILKEECAQMSANDSDSDSSDGQRMGEEMRRDIFGVRSYLD